MTETITLQIGGMTCVRCAGAVEHALGAVDGIEAVSVSYANERAEVTYDTAKTDRKRMEKAVKAAGYTVVEDKAAFRRRELRELTILFAISAVLSAPFMLMMVLMFAAPDARLTHMLAQWLVPAHSGHAGAVHHRLAVLQGRLPVPEKPQPQHGRAGGAGHHGGLRVQSL